MLRRLEWQMRGRRVETSLAGSHRSIFRGRGIEFDQVVRFEFGDDIREIDWNVTARLGDVYRKIFVEDREANVVIVFADSPALQFGSSTRSKREVLLEAAALVMLIAQANRERVMLIHRSSAATRLFPPTRDRARILPMLGHLFEQPPPDVRIAGGDLSPLVREPLPRSALILHFGDVPDAAPPPEWGGWRRRHRAIGVCAEDGWDRDGPASLAEPAYDPLSGTLVCLTDDDATRARHGRWRAEREARWRAWWPSPADRLVIDTEADTLSAISHFLRARDGGRAVRMR
ncbi:DUF58 domain-containing protein [Sandarakinorhabdus rubra]|uniref:DUF58 domain-containing protein n=1 Tax=Sandarakinorhabdus rubra TaxID=2672568 RepID=UPI001969D1FA|nr:DUF58 domain-containing protein [Sandarakinorhabdus rubra]